MKSKLIFYYCLPVEKYANYRRNLRFISVFLSFCFKQYSGQLNLKDTNQSFVTQFIPKEWLCQ